MKFNKQLFLLFLIFINPVISQKTVIELNKNTPIIQKEDRLYVFSENPHTYDLNNKVFIPIQVSFTSDFDFFEFNPYLKNNQIVFLNKTSGVVYHYRNDSIIRVDDSYYDKIHSNSLNFIYNNSIHRFGGYGYFGSNNRLTKYDINSNQWDLIKYEGFDEIKPFSDVGFHYIFKNKLYVFGFNSHTKVFQDELNLLKEGFILDIKEKEIDEVFDVNPKLGKPKCYVDLNNGYVFLFYPKIREILVLKKEDSTLYKHEMSIIQSTIFNSRNESFGIHNGKLFYLSRDIDGNINFEELDINSIIKNSTLINISPYLNNKFIYKILIGIGFFIFILLVFILVKKKVRNKNKFYIKDNQLLLSNELIIYDKRTIQIISELLSSEFVSNSNLNNYFNSEGLNQIHVNREKNKFIQNLNMKLSFHAKQDIITKEKDEYDKRMIIFKINKDLFRKQS